MSRQLLVLPPRSYPQYPSLLISWYRSTYLCLFLTLVQLGSCSFSIYDVLDFTVQGFVIYIYLFMYLYIDVCMYFTTQVLC